MTNAATLERYAPYALGVLRIVTALIFLSHGAQKLFGFPAMPPGGAMPEAFSFMWFGGALEFFGGLLLLVGCSPAASPSSSPARWRSPIGCFTRPRASFRC